MLVLFIALLVIFVCLVTLQIQSAVRRPQGVPPGPPKWPIIGNFLNISLTRHWGLQFLELSKKHGRIFSFSCGELDYIILNDFEDIRAVMNMEEAQSRPRVYYTEYMVTNFENAGIFLADGLPWRERRRFCLRNLREFGFGKASAQSIVLDEFKSFVAYLRKNTQGSSNAKDGSFTMTFDVDLERAVANVIWSMITNKRLTSSAENDEFSMMFKTVLQVVNFTNLAAILSFMPSILRWCPGWVYGEKQMAKTKSLIYNYLKQSLLEEHERTLDPASPRDLLDKMLIHRKENQNDNLTNEIWTDHAIIVALMEIVSAGYETTAITIRWFFLYMLEHPEVQAKVIAEIDRVVGKDREPQWADYANMPYTVAAIHELSRVATIVPNGVDHAAEATFSYKGYTFPKGTNITANLYAVHVDPKIWGDPENFRPERFLDETGKFVKHPCLIPFQIGKRQCMGESLAKMTSFLGIVYLLQLFSFEKVDGEKYTLESNVAKSPLISMPFPYKLRAIPRLHQQ